MNKWELERQKFAKCFLRTVRGALPLSLTHSLAKECGLTVYGNTQKFVTIGGVKYPVPDDVTLVDYVSSAGATAIDLGIIPVSTDDVSIRRKHKGTGTATSSYFGCMPSSQSLLPRFSFGKYNSGGAKSFAGFNKTPIIADVDTNWHTDRAYYADNTYYAQRDTDSPISYTPDQGTSAFTLTAYLFARHGDSGVQVYDGEGTDIALLDWKSADGTQRMLVMGAIRNNVVGIYDFVSKSFIAPTVGTLTAGKMTRTETIGGESIEVPICEYEFAGERTANLWDKSKSTTNWVNGSGEIVPYTDGTAQMSDFVECEQGDTFSVRGFKNGSVFSYMQIEIAWFDSDKTFIGRETTVGGSNDALTGTAPTNAKFCKFGVYKPSVTTVINHDVMAVKGSTVPTEYIPYGYDVPVRIEGVNLFDVNETAIASIAELQAITNLYYS